MAQDIKLQGALLGLLPLRIHDAPDMIFEGRGHVAHRNSRPIKEDYTSAADFWNELVRVTKDVDPHGTPSVSIQRMQLYEDKDMHPKGEKFVYIGDEIRDAHILITSFPSLIEKRVIWRKEK